MCTFTAVFLAGTQLFLLFGSVATATSSIASDRHEHHASVAAAASSVMATSSLEPSPPPPLNYGAPLDLDARYPPETSFWSDVDSNGRPRGHAHWLSALRRGKTIVPIPRRLHQTWKDATPPRKLFSPRWAQSLRDHNPGWQYTLWTDAQNRDLVARRYPHLLRMYDSYPSAIQRADVARYLIADAFGGMYADLDTECFQPFAPLTHGRRAEAAHTAAAAAHTAAHAAAHTAAHTAAHHAGGSLASGAGGHSSSPPTLPSRTRRAQPFPAARATRSSARARVIRSGASWWTCWPTARRRTSPPDTPPCSTRPARLCFARRSGGCCASLTASGVTPYAMGILRSELGISVLDAKWLHLVTAD